MVDLRKFVETNGIRCIFLKTPRPYHSINEAAEIMGTSPTAFVKTVFFIDSKGKLVACLVSGEDYVDTKKVGSVRPASPAEIAEKTGYPVGATPPFGYPATFLIDPKVLDKAIVFSGGGSFDLLIKFSPLDLLNAVHGELRPIAKV